MKELRQFEFFQVRYVPDTVKNEFVNIGVMVREAAEDRGGETLVRFTRDWQRVRCLDPDADTSMLERLETDLRQRLASTDEGAKPFLVQMLDSWSNTLQISDAKACLAENLAAAMDTQMKFFVERRKREAIPVSRGSGREAIRRLMQREFERVGVWELLRKRIKAATYTQPGDPLRIDCGYRPNGVIRMFHAVSLRTDAESAKVLAFSVTGLREGIRREEKAELELTAIIEPLGAWPGKTAEKDNVEVDGDQSDEYRFAVSTMEREAIRVLTTERLPGIADTALLELRG
jgi:hypothetical protein